MILRGLRRYWWQALALWAVASVGLAALIHAKVEPSHEAFSLLRVDPSSRDVLGPSLGSKDLDGYLETQVKLVTSPSVLSAVLARPEIAALPTIKGAMDAESELRDLVRVEIIPRTQLIRVSTILPSAKEPAPIVNAVVEEFRRMDQIWSAEMTRLQIEHLEGYREELEREVQDLEREMEELASKGDFDALVFRQPGGPDQAALAPGAGGASADPGSDRFTPDEYKALRSKLNDIEVEMARAEAGIGALRARSPVAGGPGASGGSPDEAIREALQGDPDVREAGQGYQAALARWEEARRRTRQPSDPARRQAEADVKSFQAEYARVWREKEEWLRKQVAQGVAGPVAGPIAEDLREAELRAEELRIARDVLEDQLAKADVVNKEQSTDAVRAIFLKANWEQHRTMLQSVESRLEQLRIDERGLGRINVISAARPPVGPVSDKRFKFQAMAPAGLLAVIVAALTLLELLSARVSGPDEMSSRMAVEVFSVPPLPVVRPGGRPGDDDPVELFVQQLDHLRVALCGEANAEAPGRCVLITSAAGGEGKTTLAAQLAVRCAEAGAATLLIDADLRRASLGRLFEVPECPGLSDVLRGDVAVEDALVPVSQVGGCQLLPAGTPEENPSRVLQGQRIGPLLERLRRDFDVILIDTPPVLPVPDALILGRRADGVVLATRHDRSRFPLVERARQMLVGAGVPLMGVVINGVRSSEIRYGTYAYSYRSTRAGEGPAAS